MISVIIPTFDDASHLPRTLSPLVNGVAHGLIKEVIVSDGGSSDETLEIAEAAGCDIIVGPKGRAKQMRAGVGVARASWLLFLHADTALSDGWDAEVSGFVRGPRARMHAAAFRLAFDDPSPDAQRTLFWARIRADWLKLPYGDQGLLISRLLYEGLGGFQDLSSMEDIDLLQRIGRKRLSVLKSQATISADKYRRGYGKRLHPATMARYLIGANPAELSKAYD
jgi:rSAM/selenodomain-associated transferase 2